MTGEKDYIVKPVQKAITVLLCLGEARRPLSLAAISRKVAIPKTTVFRYLQTLQASGFVTHHPESDEYGLGLRIFELAKVLDEQLHVRRVAIPEMEKLRDRFNETVNLGVLDGGQIIYVEMLESHHALRMEARPGTRDQIYSTALGKAIMAHLPESQWQNLLPEQMVPITDRTITSIPALRNELALVSVNGYSVDDGENEADAYCIGAPIFNHLGNACAAISVSAPNTRLSDVLKREIAEAVMAACNQVSEQLGHSEF